jgi:plasmid stability protein
MLDAQFCIPLHPALCTLHSDSLFDINMISNKESDMPNILIRDLSPETVKQLKARAHRNARSMQSELKSILEGAAKMESLDAALLSARIRRMLGDREHTDSADLVET